jgi:urease accessory protein UreF
VDASTAWEMPACFGTIAYSTGNFWTVLSYYISVVDAAALKQWQFTELAPHQNCQTGIASSAGKDFKQRLPKKLASGGWKQRLQAETVSRDYRQELRKMGSGANRSRTQLTWASAVSSAARREQ